MLKIIVFVKSFVVPLLKKIHRVMLSDVIVNIFNSHMTLYLNIMKAQGFLHIIKAFSILSKQTRHSFHKALLP